MPVGPGARLGPYEIVSALGAGGMGEVYRARDTRLNRDVAIKIIPAAYVSDTERLARFEQEARAAAVLNHPNILAVYDIGREPSTIAGQAPCPFIVSELLEGQSLRERLANGPLPVRKAMDIAIQVARGLAAAHEKGIIHRDLKPENVFITTDDRAKLLDFGLAKLTQPTGALAGASVLPTTPHQTTPGVVLGTTGYMSPEQVRGQEADARSDIFAFGAVFYEMLAGRRAFGGDTSIDALSAILKDDPPELPIIERRIPPAVARIVDRCLEKTPDARFQSTRDLAFALEALSSTSESGRSDARFTPARARLPRGSALIAWSIAALSLAAAAAMGVLYYRQPSPVAQTTRLDMAMPGSAPAEHITFSPDGRALALVASQNGINQIWVRTMDALDARPLQGTDNATYPFWSPDGEYIGFFAQGKLKKIPVAGGPPQTLCDAASGRGGTWNRDGVILFSPGPTSPIMRVPATGGRPTAVTAFAAGETSSGHRFPAFLPDGVHFLYTVGSAKPDTSGLYAGSLDGGAPTRLLPYITNGIYVPAPGGGMGRLVFRHDDTLVAQPFDVRTLTLSGDMLPVVEHVPTSVNVGYGAFAVSQTGTLAYRVGDTFADRQIVWIDRGGKQVGIVGKPGGWIVPQLSPDQHTVVVEDGNGSQSDVWLDDLQRDTQSRFTFRSGFNRLPVWSSDGKRIVFTYQDVTGYSTDLYVKSASGGGGEELLLHGAVNTGAQDWSADGTWLLFGQTGQSTGNDIWLLPLTGDRKPRAYLTTPFQEGEAQFAPGAGAPKWIAYTSNESGRDEVYVQSFVPGSKYQISTMGGSMPRWRRDGKELFYLSVDKKLMAVPITLGDTVAAGTPTALFANPGMSAYTPASDGQRFVVNVPAGGTNAMPPPLTVVLNWASSLKP